ncbi:MAG TPA: potassium-transporting ATPase subunit KdpC [Rhizomicrobium sp.]
MKELRTCLTLFLLLLLLTGIAYPLAVLGIGQTLFPTQADGSLLKDNGAVIGSSLIGQSFTSPAYFHPRPSAAGAGYDASNSSGSNLAPTSDDLSKSIRSRAAQLKTENGVMAIPVDLVTSSASGLDPDISPAAARFQVPRIALARGVDTAKLLSLVNEYIVPPTYGLLGDSRVNVLELNRALDQIAPLNR